MVLAASTRTIAVQVVVEADRLSTWVCRCRWCAHGVGTPLYWNPARFAALELVARFAFTRGAFGGAFGSLATLRLSTVAFLSALAVIRLAVGILRAAALASQGRGSNHGGVW